MGSSMIWFFGMYTKSPELNAALFSAVYLSSLEFDDLLINRVPPEVIKK